MVNNNTRHTPTPLHSTLHRGVFQLLLISACSVGLSVSAHAYANDYNNARYMQANTTTTLKQPKVRWYRYYSPSGEPNLSSTITAQHLRYGYEALDRNMQVIKQVSPYLPDQYAQQKKEREAQKQITYQCTISQRNIQIFFK